MTSERWSAEQVAASAPDSSSLAAARKLATPGPWSRTGATSTLLWGQCQGSGATPYQVSIDLLAPAYRCSCPSRKFPCKHALALLLLWSEGAGVEEVADLSQAADFAAEWAQGRARRAEKAVATTTAEPADETARAKRVDSRLALMDAGVADLGTWLRDVVRAGLADLHGRPPGWFDAVGARLVDAQCPALAAEVRELPTALRRDDWQDRATAALGRWWTIVRAWERRADLDDDSLADVRAALGWSWTGDEVRARGVRRGHWLVLGVQVDLHARLTERRTWLRSTDGDETVVVLDFAPAGGLGLPHTVGAVIEADVATYPGAEPRRALAEVVGRGEQAPFPAGTDVAGAHAQIAAHHGRNPLARHTPLLLGDVLLTSTQVQDAQGRALPIAGRTPWGALAASGGHPVTAFGEWGDDGLRLLTVVADGQVTSCA